MPGCYSLCILLQARTLDEIKDGLLAAQAALEELDIFDGVELILAAGDSVSQHAWHQGDQCGRMSCLWAPWVDSHLHVCSTALHNASDAFAPKCRNIPLCRRPRMLLA